MSYTPPLGNAVNFDGTGAAYTPPVGSAVNFDTIGGTVSIPLQGQLATAQLGAVGFSIGGGDFSVALFGLESIALSSTLVPSIPGGAVSVELNGQQATCQQGGLAASNAVVVALSTQLVTTQRGPLIASTPQSVSVPLVSQFVTVQKDVLLANKYTGLIEWYYSRGQIVRSGTPVLKAVCSSSGHPGVYSTGAEETVGGKRYFEIAMTGQEMSFGIGNAWRYIDATTYPFGFDPVEDVWSWGLQLQANGQLRSLHNGAAIAQGAYTYIIGAPLQCAIDFTAGYLWFGYNGTWVGGGDPAAGTNPTYTGVSGFPHPVVIYGTMGGNIVFPQTDTALLHASINNQLYRPAGFLPWEDSEGVPVTIPLSGAALSLQTAPIGVYIVTGSDVSLTLLGQFASMQLGALLIHRDRPQVTWNPMDKSVWINLTDNNYGIIASPDTPDQNTHIARATLGRGRNTGKYYFEITVPQVQEYLGGYHRGPGIGLTRYNSSYEIAENEMWFGSLTYAGNAATGTWQLAEKSFNLAADGFGGGPGPEDPIYGYGKHYDWIQGSEPEYFVPGRVLQLAVDFTEGKIWFGYNGKWFNSSNGSNPATGMLPQYTNLKTLITTFTEYPSGWPDFVSGYTPPSSNIGHFNLKSFHFEPPAGFFPWEEGSAIDKVSWIASKPLTIERGRFSVLVNADLFIELLGLQATAQQNTAFFRRTDAPVGRELTVQQGTLTATVVFDGTVVPLTGQFLTTASDVLGTVVVDGTSGILTGQQVSVQQGILAASYIEVHTVALTGQELSVQSGGFAASIGSSLNGLQVTAEHGSLGCSIAVALTGQALIVLRGMFPYFNVDVPLYGQQCAVQAGTFITDVGAVLTGKSLSITSGVLIPASSLLLTGELLQSSHGVLIPHLAVSLSGLSAVTQLSTLKPESTVSLTGQQVEILQSLFDFSYDCNVFPVGVQAIGKVGVEPTLTNGKPPVQDTLLWARAEVHKLFVVIEPVE